MNPELQRLIDKVKDASGYPVTIAGDADMATHSRMVSATTQRPVHTIFVHPTHERFGDYLVALQCSMLLAKWANPGQVFDFTVRQDKLDYLVEKYGRRAEAKGMAHATAVQFTGMVVNGVLLQLNSLPLQMMSIEFVHAECPSLAEQGRMSGRQELQDMSRSLAPEVRASAPENIVTMNAAMNAAFALFWSRLTSDTVCVLPYKVLGFLPQGTKLLAAYDAVDQKLPGRHRAVVDAWAGILHMDTWYHWAPRAEP
jgi:hypothetical protein